MSTFPELSRRGDIRLGYRCNARCGFCYYQDLLDTPVEDEPSTEELRQRLEALRRDGATEVEFTGGEPTIRPDLAELVAYARELQFINVSVISNGLRLANPKYAQRLVEAGANDFLFSVHGPDAVIHDAHTRIPGSFEKILQAIENVRTLGARCRSTTTVTGQNYKFLESILQLSLDRGMACIHLAVFSPVADAVGTDEGLYVTYTDAAASIKRAIDRFEHLLPPLSVKYIPFCFMRGYEKYVMNLYQQNYDPDDWNYYYSNKVRRASSPLARLAFDCASLVGAVLTKDWVVSARHGWFGLRVFGFTRIAELVRKRRLAACKECAYDNVCDHVWVGYVDRFGEGEIAAVPGPKVKDPAWAYVMSRYRSTGVRVNERAPVLIPVRSLE